MVQVKRIFPGFWAGISTTVVPVLGRVFWIPSDGMVNPRVQPFVLFVFSSSLIGCPALACSSPGE